MIILIHQAPLITIPLTLRIMWIGQGILKMSVGKLPLKLKRFEIESVKQKLYEKFKIYGVTNRCDFKTSRRWHVGQRDLSSTRHQPADIF